MYDMDEKEQEKHKIPLAFLDNLRYTTKERKRFSEKPQNFSVSERLAAASLMWTRKEN